MPDLDPYAPPKSELEAPPADFAAEGKWLLCRDGAILPKCCIKTGEALPPGNMHAETFKWARTGRLLATKVTVTYGMSPATRYRWARFRLASKVCAWLAIGLVWLSISMESLTPVAFSIAVLLVGSLLESMFGRSLKIRGRKPSGEYKIAGCCSEFLAALPSDRPVVVLPES